MSQPNPSLSRHNSPIVHGAETAVNAIAIVALSPHYHVFKRMTSVPITGIVNSTTPEEARENIARWCRRKTNESSYVQVAGAVMFASVVSCLGWDAVKTAHWSASALWYVSILFALASIFTAAQQILVLPREESVKSFTLQRLDAFKESLGGRHDEKPSWTVLFAWQVPIMMLGYSVAAFVGGLCSVVITPLATAPAWDGSAKTVVIFCVATAVIGISAVITTSVVHRADIGP